MRFTCLYCGRPYTCEINQERCWWCKNGHGPRKRQKILYVQAFHLRCPGELLNSVRYAVKETNITMNLWIIRAIEERLAREANRDTA